MNQMTVRTFVAALAAIAVLAVLLIDRGSDHSDDAALIDGRSPPNSALTKADPTENSRDINPSLTATDPARTSSRREHVPISEQDIDEVNREIKAWLTEVPGTPEKVRKLRLERFHLYSICLAYDDYSADPNDLKTLLASPDTEAFIRSRLYQILSALDPELQDRYEPTPTEVLEVLRDMRPEVQRQRDHYAESLPEWISEAADIIIADQFLRQLHGTANESQGDN